MRIRHSLKIIRPMLILIILAKVMVYSAVLETIFRWIWAIVRILMENMKNLSFGKMRDGGKVTNKYWDADMVAMLNDDGELVDGCGDLFDNLTTEEIFNDDWILIIN